MDCLMCQREIGLFGGLKKIRWFGLYAIKCYAVGLFSFPVKCRRVGLCSALCLLVMTRVFETETWPDHCCRGRRHVPSVSDPVFPLPSAIIFILSLGIHTTRVEQINSSPLPPPSKQHYKNSKEKTCCSLTYQSKCQKSALSQSPLYYYFV